MGTIRCTRKEFARGLDVPLDERTKVVVSPDAVMASILGRAFDPGKCFPLPRVLPALRQVFDFALGLQQPKAALVVSHTEVGIDDADELSKTRAAVLAAWLEGEPQPWLDNYAAALPAAKRWGAREDHALLAALPDVPKLSNVVRAPSPNVAKNEPARDALISAYQELRQLKVDGVAGPDTRKALIEDFFALTRNAQRVANEAEAEAPAAPAEPVKFDMTIAAHGAGDHFSLQDVAAARAEAEGKAPLSSPHPEPSKPTGPNTDAAGVEDELQPAPKAGDARVDFIFFFAEAGVEPAPAAASGEEYLEWVKLSALFEQFRAGDEHSGVRRRLALQLWDKAGQIPHAQREYSISGPEEFVGSTDAQGKLEHDDVAAGDYSLTLKLTFFEGADQIVKTHTSPIVVLDAGAEPQIRLLGAVPRCTLVRLGGLLFEKNKAFLLPSAIKHLTKIRQVYEQNDHSALLVVGHTDNTGDASVNDPLSLERAQATVAYLKDDVPAWLAFYDTGMPATRRWGAAEDAHLLRAVNNLNSAPKQADFDAFKVSNGITEQGVGSATRRALISQYMALDGVSLDHEQFDIVAIAHGCGAHFPWALCNSEHQTAGEDTRGAEHDRRVELFFFSNDFGIVPPPPGDNSPAGGTQYLAWRELAEVSFEAQVDGIELLEDCDDCGLFGPPGFEPGAGNVSRDIAPGDQGSGVGLAQILLNDFIAQMRLAQALPKHVEPQSFQRELDALPTFLKVDCTFGPKTEAATRLYQTWHGGLEVSGTLERQTWTRLMQTTELYQHVENRPLPPFPEVEGQVQLAAVEGLAAEQPVLLASLSDSIPSAGLSCARSYAPAKDFEALVTLIRDAETLLATCGVNSPGQALSVLRGIYYGTPWSSDYKKERSVVRNAGFNMYATGSPFEPADPRACLQCNLFEALQGSQDAKEGSRHFDWGHAIIGLEARYQGETSNKLLTHHSGLEAATWLGDLGGGAAMLADSRASKPKTRATTRFTGTNFGGSINIEGDIASYVIANDPASSAGPSKPVFGASSTPIGDAVEAYLSPKSKGSPAWLARSQTFLQQVGGAFSGTKLENRSSVVAQLQLKIEEFGAYYLVNRLRQSDTLRSGKLRAAAEHLEGAAQEVAEVFVDALAYNVTHPSEQLRAVTDPAPLGTGRIHPFCARAIQSVEAMETTEAVGRDLLRKLRVFKLENLTR